MDRPALDAALSDLSDLQVQTGADVRRQHGTDESWHPPAPPDAVVYPRTTEEAVRVVAACARHDVPIVPFGAGTSLEGHIAAPRGGICVDMSEMNAVLRLSVDDLDVTVQAGVTRVALDDRLRREGVFFPVDPGADATVGGMIATGASGTTTVRYGAMRENVLSLKLITAAGELIHTGSRARKSSAGYDLTRLMIGSEGTLGLIAEATLRLRPTPEAMSAAVGSFATLEAAVDCVIAVLQYGIPIARIELLDEMTMDAVERFDALGYPLVPTLFFEFHGSTASVAEQAAETEELANEHGAERFTWTADESERRRLWRARHRAYDATRALRPGARGVVTDACVPVSRLAECVADTRRDIEASRLVASILGHVGDGNFHTTILVDTDDADEVARAMAFSERLVHRALDAGGTCTGEHGIGSGKTKYLELEHGAGSVALMRAIKAALDPRGIFNPGKVLP